MYWPNDTSCTWTRNLVLNLSENARQISKARLDELIDEAIVDCWGAGEEHTALLTMSEERVVCPFRAKLIGETIEVRRFEWPRSGYGLITVCRRKGRAYRVDVNSLEWLNLFRKALNGSPLIRRGANVTIKRQYGYRKGWSHFVGIQQIRRIRIAIQNHLD
jgi:hypothetical protein